MNVVERATAEALAGLGHEVELITRRNAPDDPDLVELTPGVWLRHLTAGPQTPLAKSEIDEHIPEFSDRLGDLGPYDVVHSHHWMSGVAALPHAHNWGIPHIQSYHSVAALPGSPLSDGEPPESPARVPGEALVARESQAVVAISAAEASTVIQRCGADPDKVRIVPPGVNLDLFRPLHPGEDGWAPTVAHRPSNGYVLYAARLQPLKAPDLAINALACLPPDIRPHLVIAGDVSADFAAYEAQLIELVAQQGLTDDVSFVGPQTRVALATLMRSARVMLVPSHSETFGLVALEAAASGTPVIAASAGGLREAVAHGQTGQLMDSRRPSDWADALTLLITNPQRLRQMSIVSRVHARRFTWEWAAIQLASLYRDLVDG